MRRRELNNSMSKSVVWAGFDVGHPPRKYAFPGPEDGLLHTWILVWMVFRVAHCSWSTDILTTTIPFNCSLSRWSPARRLVSLFFATKFNYSTQYLHKILYLHPIQKLKLGSSMAIIHMAKTRIIYTSSRAASNCWRKTRISATSWSLWQVTYLILMLTQ